MEMGEKVMSKYSDWYDVYMRTIKSRERVLDMDEIERNGILEVINYISEVDAYDEDRMHQLIRQGMGHIWWLGPSAMGIGVSASLNRAILVDSAVRGIRDEDTGDVGYVRVYSGIVFRNEWYMNIWLLRNEVDYPELGAFPRLVN